MLDFLPYNNRWKYVTRGTPATEKQQALLEKIGWGRDDFTVRGAWHLIRANFETDKLIKEEISEQRKKPTQLNVLDDASAA